MAAEGEFPKADGDILYASEVNSIVPVGAIIAWLKNLPNCPALPSNFVECNGQTLSDASSVFNGQTIPDLNELTETTLTLASLTGGLNSVTGKSGHKITVGAKDIKITGVTKYSTTTATHAYILDSLAGVLSTAIFDGNYATFDYTLSAGNIYYIVVDKEGSSYSTTGNTTNYYPYKYDQMTINNSTGAGNGTWTAAIWKIDVRWDKGAFDPISDTQKWILKIK